MPTNFIKIFDDTVIKMSVNQGLEDQRTSETLGTFTVGELAYVRDTGRLFVGDNSDGEEGHRGLQETVGGTLVGNKYLGLIDSKPLVTFYNNGMPLSYEETTTQTGTQEASTNFEPGLFVKGSKFRLRSTEDADEQWDNWDRKSVYNPKYNAYNGDFVYDIYQNAFILFDTRISGNKDSDTQPQIKKGEDGLPVAPETFIVNGKEIPSSSPEALSITRRSQLLNYSKDNKVTTNEAEITNDEMIYGDGYVIIRNIEPDNITVRFKPRSFQLNGLPDDINNYTHNLIEVFHIPTEVLRDNFTDDFIVTDVVALNKHISYVHSITGYNGSIKFPNDITFSTPISNGRDGLSLMNWHINKPTDIVVPGDDSYYLLLTPKQELMENGERYISFDGNLVREPKIRPPYYIKLEGISSSQAAHNMLTIDETTMNVGTAPTLSVELDENLPPNNFSTDPYAVTTSIPPLQGYTGNYTIGNMGTITYIDEFPDGYYSLAKYKADHYEEQNTSINYLKVPVTIAQSSSATNLFAAIPAHTWANVPYNANISVTNSGTRLNGNIDTLYNLAVAAGKFYYALNGNTVISTELIDEPRLQTKSDVIENEPQQEKIEDKDVEVIEDPDIEIIEDGDIMPIEKLQKTDIRPIAITSPSWAGMSLNIPPSNGSNGVGAIVTSNALPNMRHIRTITVNGEVSGIAGGVDMNHKMTLFCALINYNNGVHVLKEHTFDQFYSNFTFAYTMDTKELLLSGTNYLAVGFLGESLSSEMIVKFTSIKMEQCTVNAEQAFQLMPVGANIMLDYMIDPDDRKLYCAEKIVSTPYTGVLPKVEQPNQWPGSNEAYFNSFNQTNVKVWNDLFCVLGRNHYANMLSQPEYCTTPLYGMSATSDIKKGAFIDTESYLFTDTEVPEIYIWNTIDSESDIEFFLFAWYKDYTKAGGKESDIKYYPHPVFDISTDYEQTDDSVEHAFITSVKMEGNNTELITGPTGTIVGSEEPSPDGENRFRKLYAIPITSSLWTRNEQYINYVCNGHTYSIDMSQHNVRFDYTYELTFDERPQKVIVYDKAGKVAGTIDGSTFPFRVEDIYYTITAETVFLGNKTINDFKYIAFQMSNDITPDGSVERWNVYGIAQNVPYAISFHAPGRLSNVHLWDGSKYVESAILDETIESEDEVYIPANARNVVLEVTYDTTLNSTIAIFYARKFEHLGNIFSGWPIEEFNNPGAVPTDLILNPSNYPAFRDNYYKNNTGTYKHKLGKPIAVETEAKKFHVSTDSLSANQKRIPSMYSANKQEKCMMLTSSSESRIIEVPLQKQNPEDSNGDDRHFALRVANIRPSNADVLNVLTIRIIGYRV